MKAITTLILAVLVLGLAGCNTVGGIGKDVEAAGEVIKKSSGK